MSFYDQAEDLRLATFHRLYDRFPFYQMLGNARYWVAPHGARPNPARHEGVAFAWHDPGLGVDVYEIAGYLPRAFVVHQVQQIPDEEAALAFVADKLTPDGISWFRDHVVVDRWPADMELPAEPGASRMRWLAHQANRVALVVDTEVPAVLVMIDQYYPGWQLTVDGAPREILQADYNFRGVALAPGRHTVTFEYRPRLFYLGLKISGATAFLLVVAAVYYRRRKSIPSSRK